LQFHRAEPAATSAELNRQTQALSSDLALRSTVGAAIHLDRVPPELKVYKLYDGKPVPVEFDRASPEILGLVLNGGEKISWK